MNHDIINIWYYEEIYKNIYDFLKSDITIFSIIIQNAYDEKNSNRVSRIEEKKYTELMTEGNPKIFLDKILENLLLNRLKSAESELIKSY